MMMTQPPSRKLYDGADPESALLWPYRSTPLVLQGPKITKDPAPAMCYLRHHPNPMMRSKPAEYEWIPADIAKKQQFADSLVDRAIPNDWKTGNKKVVTKPYNSPIGLYSDQNIANSVYNRFGSNSPDQIFYNPPHKIKKIVTYDPLKSETYKVLHETEMANHHSPYEMSAPGSRVFSPVRTPTKHLSPPTAYSPNRASPQPHPTAPHPKNFKAIDNNVHPFHLQFDNAPRVFLPKT